MSPYRHYEHECWLHTLQATWLRPQIQAKLLQVTCNAMSLKRSFVLLSFPHAKCNNVVTSSVLALTFASFFDKELGHLQMAFFTGPTTMQWWCPSVAICLANEQNHVWPIILLSRTCVWVSLPNYTLCSSRKWSPISKYAPTIRCFYSSSYRAHIALLSLHNTNACVDCALITVRSQYLFSHVFWFR